MTSAARQALISGLYGSVGTGYFYGFSVYSSALKTRFRLSQSQLANINTFPYLFGLISPFVGMVSKRWLGPRNTLLAAGVLGSACQFLLYLLATTLSEAIDSIAPIILPTVTCINYLVCICTLTSVVFSTPVLYYPRARGEAVAIVKSFVGLGGAFVTQLFVVLFGKPGKPGDSPDNALNCILLWSLSTLATALFAAAMYPSKPPDPSRAEPTTMLSVLFGEIILLGCFSIVVSFVPQGDTHTALAILLACLVVAPVPIGLLVGRRGGPCNCMPYTGREVVCVSDASGLRSPLTMETPQGQEPILNEEQCGTRVPLVEAEQQLTLSQMLRTPDAWLFWWFGVTVIGSGSLIVTNLSQICESAGSAPTIVPTALTCFSAGNLLGRLCSMGPSDALVRHGRSRLWSASLIALLMCLAQLGFLYAAAMPSRGGMLQHSFLVVSSGMAGVAFGATWPHLVVLASELFGSKNLQINYMFFDGGCASVGTIFFANVLPSALYQPGHNISIYMDLPVASDDSVHHGATCLGPSCFGITHTIVASLCASGAISAAIAARRSAPLYWRMRASA